MSECRVFLLSDPHLGREMSGFGERWANHVERIRVNWLANVGPRDVVLVPGDISWRKSLDEVRIDFDWLDALPGRYKVLVKGNHDWWWGNVERVRAVLPPSLVAVDADAHWLADAGLIVAGAKGFLAPPDPYYGESDRKAFLRNLRRLDDALAAAAKLVREHPEAPVVVLVHYPPYTSDGQPTPFSQAIERSGFVRHCVFGHFHFRNEWAACPQGEHNGVHYWLGSADYLEFVPRELFRVPR